MMAKTSPAPSSADAPERRGGVRQKTFLRGRVLYNNRQSSVDCVIRDYSHSGARLVFSDAVPTPDVFEVEIPHKQEMIPATVQWRREGEMGVEFHRARMPGESPDGDLELAERVRKLEDEIAELHRILVALRQANQK
jgi:hypothetical protein